MLTLCTTGSSRELEVEAQPYLQPTSVLLINHFKPLFSKMNFDLEDLNYLEKDLTIQEKVSLVFLFNGDSTQLNLSTVIDKLHVNLLKQQTPTTFLKDFAVGHDEWKEFIVDGLRTINAYQVLEKLGLEKNYVNSLPSKIDPVLKKLYEACEECTKKITEQFQKYVQENLPAAKAFDGSSTRVMEFQLLICIFNGLVNVELDEQEFLLDFFKKIQSENIVRILKGEVSLYRPDTSISKSSSDEASSDAGFYVIRNGKILIINQQRFTRDANPALKTLLPPSALKDRQGTDIDKNALSKLFEDFGYKVQVKENLTHDKIIDAVDKFVRQSSNDGTDAIFVCILSHGSEGTVYGSNSIPVQVKDIKILITTELLADIPKVLLIQACQGNDFLTKTQTPEPKIQTFEPKIQHDGPKSSATATKFGDFVTFWSSIEGFASFRHTQEGSWFIQSICKMIEKKYETSHLLDIFTDVIHTVSKEKAVAMRETMLSKFDTTFMKKFVFPGFRYNNHSF